MTEVHWELMFNAAFANVQLLQIMHQDMYIIRLHCRLLVQQDFPHLLQALFRALRAKLCHEAHQKPSCDTILFTAILQAVSG